MSKASKENEVAFKTQLDTMPKKLSAWLSKEETSQELVDWALERIATIQAEIEADLAQSPMTSHYGIYGMGHKMLLATWSMFEKQTRLWRREQAGITYEPESSIQSSKTSVSKTSSSTSGDYYNGRANSRTPKDDSPQPIKLLKQGGYYIVGANTAMEPAQDRKRSFSNPSPPMEAKPSRSGGYSSHYASQASSAGSRSSKAPYIPSRPSEAPYIPPPRSEAPYIPPPALLANYAVTRAPPLVSQAARRPPQASARWNFPSNPLPKPPQPVNIPPLRTDWATRRPPGPHIPDDPIPQASSGYPTTRHRTQSSVYARSNGHPPR